MAFPYLARRCSHGLGFLWTLTAASMLSGAIGCETLSLSGTERTASLQTDSTEIGVHLSGIAYHAKIGFVYVNTTPEPVAKAGCGFPPYPSLLKKVGDEWKEAYLPVYTLCLTKPDFSLPSGGTYRGVLDFEAFQPGHNWAPTLDVDSIDGIYRLEWDFVQGTDTEVKNPKIVRAVSNEFRMVLKQ